MFFSHVSQIQTQTQSQSQSQTQTKSPIKTTTFRYGESDIPLWRAHTPKRLAWDIVNVNRKTIYTAITMLGLPGWGKTTATQNLVHCIHEVEPSFKIHWFFKQQILKIHKIVDNLPKYQPAILIFDDVSWLLQNLPQEKKYNILHKLTTIREIIDPKNKQTQVILFLDYHYSFAVDKPFRQAPFSIQVSITNEERENYLKILGHNQINRKKIVQFVRILESAYKYNQFRVPSPSQAHPYYYYKTDDPFRPAMVFNMSQIHLLLFHKVNCRICSPVQTYDQTDPKTLLELIDRVGIDKLHKNWRIAAYMLTGRASVLNRQDQLVFKRIINELHQKKLPLEEISELLGEAKKLETKEEQKEYLQEHFSEIYGRNARALQILEQDSREKVDADSIKVDQDELAVADIKEDEKEEEEELEEKEEEEFNFDSSISQVAGRMMMAEEGAEEGAEEEGVEGIKAEEEEEGEKQKGESEEAGVED